MIYQRHVRKRIELTEECLVAVPHQQIECRLTTTRRVQMDLMTEACENMMIVIAFKAVRPGHDGVDRRAKHGAVFDGQRVHGGQIGRLQLFAP
jgi:hypothetical protein